MAALDVKLDVGDLGGDWLIVMVDLVIKFDMRGAEPNGKLENHSFM